MLGTSSSTYEWIVVGSCQYAVIFGPDWGQILWNPGRLATRVLRTSFWVGMPMSISLLNIAHWQAVPDGLVEQDSQVDAPEEVIIPSYLIYLGHGYLWHAKCRARGCHSPCCHIYLILSSCEWKDAVAFTYRARFAVVKKLATRSVEIRSGTRCRKSQPDQYE